VTDFIVNNYTSTILPIQAVEIFFLLLYNVAKDFKFMEDKMRKLSFLLVIMMVLGFSSASCENKPADDDIVDFVKIPNTFTNAVELVSYIKIGWNLGNTLDAGRPGGPQPHTVTQMETNWGNPVTSKANITTLKNAGFNTIRIPVTWNKTLDANNNIRADWMARVKQIVDYVIDNGMIAIINTHHDESIFKFTDAQVNQSLPVFEKVWGQIAETFKGYNERLVFEALNEPRTPGSALQWQGGTPEERANINKYYENFVNVVRNSGGNNDKRILMVNTYAASAEQVAMDGLVLPTDTNANRLIVSIHFYEPYNFALNTNATYNSWDKNSGTDTYPIIQRVNRAYNVFVSKGIPVVIGEFGAMNKSNEAVRAEWAEFYVKTAMDKGIPCIWWDNGGFTGSGELFGLLDRSKNTFAYPKVVSGLMKGVSGWRKDD
jgi:endoglucanase